jgi:hypothetical protein
MGLNVYHNVWCRIIYMEVMHFVTPEGFIFSIKLFVIKCSLMSAKPRCMLRQKPYCKTLDCTSPFAGLNSQLIALIYITVLWLIAQKNVNSTTMHMIMVTIAHLFNFVWCLYVLSSVLWCPLRFLHENDVRFVFASSCLWEDACLICVVCVGLHIMVSNTYCVVLSFYVLCTICCQFLWIVLFWLPLRYFLMFN